MGVSSEYLSHIPMFFLNSNFVCFAGFVIIETELIYKIMETELEHVIPEVYYDGKAIQRVVGMKCGYVLIEQSLTEMVVEYSKRNKLFPFKIEKRLPDLDSFYPTVLAYEVELI